MRPDVTAVLKELRAALERLYGPRLQDLLLFGPMPAGKSGKARIWTLP